MTTTDTQLIALAANELALLATEKEMMQRKLSGIALLIGVADTGVRAPGTPDTATLLTLLRQRAGQPDRQDPAPPETPAAED